MILVGAVAPTGRASAHTGVAQTPPAESGSDNSPTRYELDVFQSGANPASDDPYRTLIIPASSVVCDQDRPSTPAIAINPSQIRWQDPRDAGRDCVVDGTDFFRSLPVASQPYVATLTAGSDEGMGPRSAPSPIFFRSTGG